jgi:hypothetical protein
MRKGSKLRKKGEEARKWYVVKKTSNSKINK